MIVNLGFLVSRFPTMSVFATSVLSLLLGQFFLFVPENSLFLFVHRVIELGIILSCTAPCMTQMHVCVFIRDVPQSVDQSVEPDQHEDQDVPNISTEVHSSDHIGQTDRAVY
ncbi:hypothetical protein F2Q70_00021502 [Brassica cretica]|uniref:Uncharacterized protein n=1 Tax=Brassica cretica TaxID=69181 RepID=A0A8S9GS33_BRACR|nr:hypothetical protein F2Q70_00021502 [Brassica cretica]